MITRGRARLHPGAYNEESNCGGLHLVHRVGHYREHVIKVRVFRRGRPLVQSPNSSQLYQLHSGQRTV
jgi:ribosomal protein L32